MSEAELRVEALRLAISMDRIGKAPAEIVKAADAFYAFLTTRPAPTPIRRGDTTAVGDAWKAA